MASEWAKTSQVGRGVGAGSSGAPEILKCLLAVLLSVPSLWGRNRTWRKRSLRAHPEIFPPCLLGWQCQAWVWDPRWGCLRNDLRGAPTSLQVACVAVTAAMHLLFLAAFSWMLVEGLLLWSKVVAVSMRPGPRMWLYYTAGWGEACTPLCTEPWPLLSPLLSPHGSIATHWVRPTPCCSSVSPSKAPLGDT